MEINNTVIDLFESISKETPDLPAIIHLNKKYTYSQLNLHANALAQFFMQKNISKGDFICIFLEPGYDFLSCLIGIIKCGAVYIPLDTLAPQNRIHDILKDAHPKLIITNKKSVSYFTKSKYKLCFIEELTTLEALPSVNGLQRSIGAESPLCLTYTSGSTGKPKGVIIPHRAVINIAYDNSIDIQSNARMAQFGNLAFDGSTYDIWTTLLNRATLVIITLEERFDVQKLKHILNTQKIKFIFLPTGYLHQIVSSHPDTLDQVDHILFGGEQINTYIIKKFLIYRTNKNLPILLINGYGPTEATCYVCQNKITEADSSDEHLNSIGQAIHNTELYVLDKNLYPAQEGELYISGANLALGYHNCPELNKEKFIANPFNNKKPFSRIYKTGDIVKKLDNGTLSYLGRTDEQVKIGGFRVHLNEIEEQLQKHESIVMAAVIVEIGGEQHHILTAYIVFESDSNTIHADEIRHYLSQTLPPYMMPVKYHKVDELPLNVTGKVDKKNLHKLPFTDLTFHVDVSSTNETEEMIKNVWKHLLNRASIEVDKNLFDLGANSLLVSEACMQINQKIHSDLKISDILSFPTIQKLARHIQGMEQPLHFNRKIHPSQDKIAIIGMSVRLPKAKNITEFWYNLCLGTDCLTRFDELDQSNEFNSVAVKGILDDIDKFDDSFFKYNPAEARLTDPQHRVYLECVWEALEHAGVIPSKVKTKIISVFSGMSDSTYLYENILKNKKTIQLYDKFQQRIATSIGTLSTQISYRLNLKGTSVNVNTACSTGLVTVTQACQDLLNGHSDIAIAGASSIVLPQLQSYKYTTGSILSLDGYCRPFSDKANGTVFSNGVAVVVLKRLKDAIADKDTIYAIIEGCGINNDGDDKLSYTAPSLNGQIGCIKDALRQANLHPQDIGLIEAHGTGTALGDVIEFNALTSVFNEQTEHKNFCALGSVKANIGHTDVTAGLSGLIKAALCLYHKQIPPLIHFQKPNSNLSFDDSPFFVNTSLIDWKSKSRRHAGVSSFGIGGTNAHIILSEHKQTKISAEPNNLTDELIILSARTEQAQEKQTHQLLTYMHSMSTSTKIRIPDIAFTLQTGRENFQWRTFAVGKNVENITESLLQRKPTEIKLNQNHSINFLFSGQGSQYATMCVNLINTIPRFKKYVQEGSQLAQKYLHIDLFTLLHEKNSCLLNQTQYAQPVLFIIEHALAQMLIDCGIKPTALIGHSFGEYVAACIAKVFSYEDGVFLSCKRGELMAQTAKGQMLAVECTLEDSLNFQDRFEVEIALHNAPHQFVFSGLPRNIIQLQHYLEKNNCSCKLLRIQHAFHSKLMEPLQESFRALFSQINLSAPVIPIVSNVTGDWLSEHEARDPEYWYKHLRSVVQYSTGTQLILKDKHPLFIEIGPGNTLLNFTRQTADRPIDVVQTVPGYLNPDDDRNCFLNALGQAWEYGIDVTFDPLHEGTKQQHISLPTYPFQRKRCWVDPDIQSNEQSSMLYRRLWSKSTDYIHPTALQKQTLEQLDWVIFKDHYGIAEALISLLRNHDIQPIVINLNSSSFSKHNNEFYIDGTIKEHYVKLFEHIKKMTLNPVILHCASLFNTDRSELLQNDVIDSLLTRGFYSILYLSQAFIKTYGENNKLKIAILTNGLLKIQGEEVIYPPNAAIKGAAMVIMQENPYFKIRIFDLNFDEPILKNNKLHYGILYHCIQNPWDIKSSFLSAYRNGYEWRYTYGKIQLASHKNLPLKDNGVYLITGGLGGIAQNCCEILSETVKHPSLILLTRRLIPTEQEWEQIRTNPNHSLYQEIMNLIHLKNLGAKLHLYQVDITDRIAIDTTITAILSTFGHIDGVIHTAGEVNPSPFMHQSQATCHNTFRPKIHGTYNLIHALNQTPVDFIIFISSLSSIMGGLGLVDYSAANASLDSFADSDLFSFATFVQSINWNSWKQTGLTGKHTTNELIYFLDNQNDITPGEGQKLFLEALAINENHIAVSKNDPMYISSNSTPNKDFVISEHSETLVKLSHHLGSTEQQMIGLWQDTLGIKSIGLNDNFFSHGGHSLLALNLIERINQTFHYSLSPNQLHKTPTIKSLIKEMEHHNLTDLEEIVVPLKIMNNQPPFLFLFHPINGLLFCFNSFVSESDLNVSIFGLQDPGIRKKELKFASLIEVAQIYLQAIIKTQPKGPYFFLGYSFGGTLCYEVASLLQQRGETVALLGMIDSWAINSHLGKNKDAFNTFIHSLHSERNPELSELAWKRQELLLNHPITHTSQKIILFKAKELLIEYKAINDPANGWSQYTNNEVVCYELPGNHHSIMEASSIRLISEILKTYL
ncbi:type I polyketide synthase [Legionella shakespearei]|uniref:Polyketide synthase module n=1 Tax=Legionella shakespearei DSM 23087 TaxID=1122169 RepID=A0A0W0YIQ8_9GAMM|nr:type I polyketide synthase [Legionella shakespearei]KTD56438.1 Polyketide synthase module [Legionella shakespearei DSM 23087]